MSVYTVLLMPLSKMFVFFVCITVLWNFCHCDSSLKSTTNPKLRPQLLADILWLNATYKAEDAGLNLTLLCQPLKAYWATQKSHHSKNQEVETLNITLEHHNGSIDFENQTKINVTEPEPILWIKNKTIGEIMGLNSSLLDEYGSVGVNLGQVCLMRPRVLWINTSKEARTNGLNTTVICIPFRKTSGVNASLVEETLKVLANNDSDSDIDSGDPNHHHKKASTKKHRTGRSADNFVTPPLFPVTSPPTTQRPTNQSVAGHGLQLNVSDHEDAVLFVKDHIGAEKLNLDAALLDSYESIGIDLPLACHEDRQTVSAFNASEALGVSVDQNIGIDVTQIDGNLDDLKEKANNDTELDNIIKDTNGSSDPQRMLGGSYILPILKKVNYDKYTAPAIFQNQTVVVKVGFYVESISNFDTESMDYEMDIYLHLAWRDPRLAKLNQTINIKEQDIRDQLWLPDAYFPNAKEAEFHEVTFLNFVMHVRPSGEVLYTIRIKLKPSCHLVLCKFPHDFQTCALKIQSFAYPLDQLRFEWFSDLDEAIDLNPQILFSELSINRSTGRVKAECDGSNRIGNFTCLEARFTLTRDLGFYIAQMYVPTTLALMFSWVGVWLPEELMEGRLSVAITVLLTLSTDSVSSQEHLPTVSYMKAIDIWFAFVTAFVFFTMIQTLFVIGFDRKALTLRKRANRKFEAPEEKTKLEQSAERYHKLGRYCDQICRFAYPLIYLCFCAVYFLVITQGPQDSCVSK